MGMYGETVRTKISVLLALSIILVTKNVFPEAVVNSLSLSLFLESSPTIVYGRIEKVEVEKTPIKEGERLEPKIAYASFRVEKIIRGKIDEGVISIPFWDGRGKIWIEDAIQFSQGEKWLLSLRKIDWDLKKQLKSGVHYEAYPVGSRKQTGGNIDEKSLAEFTSAIDKIEKIFRIKDEKEQLMAVIDSLNDPNHYVQENAILDIRQRENYHKYPSLFVTILKNKDPEIRLIGASILKTTQEKLAIPILVDILKDKTNLDGVRVGAAHYLCGIKEQRVISALTEATKESESNSVKEEAYRSLVQTIPEYPEQILPILLEYLQGKKEDEGLMIKAVKEIGRFYQDNHNNENLLAMKPRVVRNLIELLYLRKNGDWWKKLIIENLGKIDAEEVIILLNYKDQDIRLKAIEVLGDIGDPKVLPRLRELSHDDVENIRKQAEAAITKIEEKFSSSEKKAK